MYRRTSTAIDDNNRTAALQQMSQSSHHDAYTPQRPSASPAPRSFHQAPQTGYSHQTSQQGSYAPATPTSYGNQYATPQQRFPQQHAVARPEQLAGAVPVGNAAPEGAVFRLPSETDKIIPAPVRALYAQDSEGHVLFFSNPGAEALPPTKDDEPLGHSLKFRAARIRRNLEIAKKKAKDKAKEETELKELKARRNKGMNAQELARDALVTGIFETMTGVPFDRWLSDMEKGTDAVYKVRDELYFEYDQELTSL